MWFLLTFEYNSHQFQPRRDTLAVALGEHGTDS